MKPLLLVPLILTLGACAKLSKAPVAEVPQAGTPKEMTGVKLFATADLSTPVESIHFGATDQARAVKVYLANPGSAPAEAVRIGGVGGPLQATGDCPTRLEPGEACELTLSFRGNERVDQVLAIDSTLGA